MRNDDPKLSSQTGKHNADDVQGMSGKAVRIGDVIRLGISLLSIYLSKAFQGCHDGDTEGGTQVTSHG